MTWANPSAVYFAAIAIPVVLCFLFRRRSRTVVVPSVQTWMVLGRPVETRSWRSLLRKLISLLVQLLIAGLLVAALGNPSTGAPASQRYVVVLDVSFTMQTREGSTTRMAEAKQKAAALISGISGETEVAMIRAAHCPMLAQALTKDLNSAKDALAQAQAMDVAGDLLTAVQLAGSLGSDGIPTTVVVVSDFAAVGPESLRAAWKSPAKLELDPIGEDSPNAAIQEISSETNAGRLLVQASIGAKGMDGRNVSAYLAVNGQRVDSKVVALGPSLSKVTLSGPATAGFFEVGIEPGDCLPSDDRAWGTIGLDSRVRICLVTQGNRPLEQALRASKSADLRLAPPGNPGPIGRDEVVVVDGDSRGLGDKPVAAGYLFIGCMDPFGLGVASGVRPVRRVTHWNSDHAVLADVDPTAFAVDKVLVSNWAPSLSPSFLVESDAGPMIAEVAADDRASGDRPRKYLYWLFSLEQTNLPRRLSFPLLLWNSIDCLLGRSGPANELNLTGGALRVPARSTGGQAVILGPSGSVSPTNRSGGSISVLDTTSMGVYRWKEDGAVAATVNLLSDQGLRPLHHDIGDNKVDLPSSLGLGWMARYKHLSWETILGLCALLGLVEWFLYGMRWLPFG